jgi:hypothetical protein
MGRSNVLPSASLHVQSKGGNHTLEQRAVGEQQSEALRGEMVGAEGHEKRPMWGQMGKGTEQGHSTNSGQKPRQVWQCRSR